ncbi:MAG TPA: hypothetical protein PK626_03650 [Bacteroidales bacterium]|jgi:hypothetical protein|nr:hypothetical protein [Bacteroidales bacterium]
MDIIKTKIIDIETDNKDNKLELFDEIIEFFLPFLSEKIILLKKQIEKVKNENSKKKKIIDNEKELLKKIINENENNKKRIMLIERIEKLLLTNKIKNKSIKDNLYKAIDNIHFLKEKQIEEFLSETVQILTKK